MLAEAVRDHHRPPADLNGPEALLQLPVFLASLLPHLDEEPTGTQRDWLITLHGQFLASTYASPDAFIQATCDAAATVIPEARHNRAPADLYHKLARAVAGDTITMVGQLCRLETALGRQRAGIDELRFHAFTDPLTKLLNRRGFVQLAERRIDDAAARGLGACCLVVDLDNLKPVNDAHGHAAGDHVLRGLAKLLRRSLDRNDLIGRIGGDEFAVFLVGVDRDRACEIAQRLMAVQGTRLRVADDLEVPLQFSLGIVHVGRMTDTIQIDELIVAADDAMYQRKRAGKAGMCFLDYPLDSDLA